MDLIEYLAPKGAAARLARRLAVPPAIVSQWRTKARIIPAERCPDIERATGGAVRCEDLRPDVDWAVLRVASADHERGA